MRILCYIVAAVSCSVSPQFARSPEVGSWQGLEALESGHKIRVETAKGKQTGTLVRLSGDAITFHSGRAGEMTIPRTEVTRVFAFGPCSVLE